MMSEIAIAGSEEFLLGFRLSGVRHTFLISESPVERLREIMGRDNIGILVLDEATMGALPEHFRDDLSRSVSPVVVALSKEGKSSSLRDQIVRAIGVDLWKD